MKPELLRVGESRAPVVVIDDFSGDAEAVGRLADALAPFPVHSANYYPGVRRVITPEDAAANAYAERTCREAAQFIAGAFDIERFDLLEASFSIVTTPPVQLQPPQQIPHFDSTAPGYLALLHYLRVPAATGTAFYRQRSTGIEQVTEDNVADFVRSAQSELRRRPPTCGYIRGSDEIFEQIESVDAEPDRMIIYQGNLLHSGIIPPDMPLSTDPREGRLTANIFVLGG